MGVGDAFLEENASPSGRGQAAIIRQPSDKSLKFVIEHIVVLSLADVFYELFRLLPCADGDETGEAFEKTFKKIIPQKPANSSR
jgi:hypothetical protein